MPAPKIDLNPQFQKALDAINQGNNVFITGKAGTGKSTLLTHFRDTTRKNVVALAPTGVAAVNIGGQTIHSFFGFKPDITVERVQREHRSKDTDLYRKIDVLIIDEISMVRADLLDCVDVFLRLNGKEKDFPFGGTQVVFFGDLYQLPPVVTSDEREIFSTYYETPFFFSSKVFQTFIGSSSLTSRLPYSPLTSHAPFLIVELETMYRQSDPAFIDILNAIRNNTATEAHFELLNSRLARRGQEVHSEFAVYLTTTNAKVREVNDSMLNKLHGYIYSFNGTVIGNFEAKSFPAPLKLDLKIGAQVMLTNNDRDRRWVNGTVGKVVDIEEPTYDPHDQEAQTDTIIWVELTDGSIVDVLTNTWESYKFTYNKKTQQVESETVGSYTQYPITLAWALTIHKAQGKTFENVIIDMDRGAFVHGQTYVALSRATSLAGIVLVKPIAKHHLRTDWRVMKFLSQFKYGQAQQSQSNEEKMRILQRAIALHKPVDIIYLKGSDVQSKRTIKPSYIGEMEYMGTFFLGVVGYDMRICEKRIFSINKILEVELSQAM